jgi:arsenite methyltransferase
MTDFDERDLVRYALKAGFAEVSLELQVSVKARKEPFPWERFLRTSGNPLVPAFGEALDRALSPHEARRAHRVSQAARRVGDRAGAHGTRLPGRRQGVAHCVACG